MNKEDFIAFYFQQEQAIEQIARRAGEIHRNVNQTYGGFLPYEFHLRLVASYVTRFGYLIELDADELQTVYAAAYFHDTLEDTRLSYNDMKKEFQRLNDAGCDIHIHEAAEAVYALTNEKGRTREERADERYYSGIRQTRFASFLKMCDRLANLRYSTLYGIRQRMAEVYLNEFPEFIASIGNVPEEMLAEARILLNEGYKRP